MVSRRAGLAALHTFLFLAATLFAIETASAQQRGGGAAGVYKSRIAPHWIEGGSSFWYRNDLSGGKREFVLVNAERGTRLPAFDHEKLAEALKAAGIEANPSRLPIETIEIKPNEQKLEFQAGNRNWQCDLGTYKLTEMEAQQVASDSRPATAPADGPQRSRTTGAETEITFENRTSGEVEVFWLDTSGNRQSYGKLSAGANKNQHTFAGHAWEVVSSEGRTLGSYVAGEAGTRAVIDGTRRPTSTPQRGRGNVDRGESRGGVRSPNGKWTARIDDHDLVIRSNDENRDVPLTRDGREGHGYGMMQWSPDSNYLVSFRIKTAERKEVHLVESSPRGGGRAVLHTRAYALPGDEFTAHELCIFDVQKQQPVECHVDKIDFGTPRIRWNRDSKTFTYQQVDRGHQRLRFVEINPQTGGSRNLIDERTDTFIWTAHTENVELRPINWLEQSDEIIYVSERDGWRHLYLADVREGAIKNQITTGEFVVRGIDRIDEDNRQVWFRASGKNAGQDPYLMHYYRVDFDGTGLVALTAGNGTHTVQYLPDHKYLIDTYSRVDQPPTHELRRTSDGERVCLLEEADISGLKADGWEAPEVFTAKARDGKTDIWGIICRPRDFDPNKKYPVIEQIYAGPQGSYVPKSFSAQRRFSSLTDLGFVVVQMDGMGTANRSKAFHDVCWKNLKDAGLPDRILWHQAAGKRYAWYDLDRVGIYGTSAGGQNSTGALLFHPDFYKVGVSACGCHDNRMDKASWNEQWMGFPVGPQYAESSNIDNAHQLKGKLMLIVGEMDTNVPPESTLRLADALIKGDKDFDLVVVPGAGHGMGGAYGSRRMRDFFVRHLLPAGK
jgi:dipeptidyl-peptidase-4